MAFKREYIANNTETEMGATKTPIDSSEDILNNRTSETLDSIDIKREYSKDTLPEEGSISTGTMIPRDMTVKLVRADSTNWEILISALYSISLTFFGIFLGSWINDIQQKTYSFTFLDKIATFFLLGLSIVLIVIWVIMKVKQKNSGILVPNDFLSNYKLNNKKNTGTDTPE